MDISAWIDRHGSFTPDKTAIIYAGHEISYTQLAERIAQTAFVLRDNFNVERGDRVGYLGLNHPDVLTLLFACARLGAMLMPVNWRLEQPEQHAIMKDCSPKVLFVEHDYLERGKQITDIDIPVICVSPCAAREGCLNEYLSDQRMLTADDASGNESDVVLLCYTSGATGQPKGVMLDQKALLTNALNSRHMHGLCANDVVLTTLPLFHVGGLNILTTPVLYSGGALVLHPAFDVSATFSAFGEQRITLTVLVPTQITAMMADGRWGADGLGNLRMITTGSTLVPAKLIEQVHQTGVPLIQVYGSTETAPLATYLTADDAMIRAGSGGKAGLHSEIRIVDGDDHNVGSGGHGEILVRGDHVMTAYWNNEQASAEAFVDGWYRTGDIGCVDDSGFLYVDDRKKDMIISGGENVYPAELENLLAEHPEIIEAAVVGQRDEKWGEIVVALVVAGKESSLSEAEVKAVFDGRLARYKHPKKVLFVEQLPRNAMGKIQKNQLREMVNGPSSQPVAMKRANQ